jgi:hypothetical protein
MTVWLHRIVAAINAADTAREDREILRAVLFAVAAIAGGTLALEIVGPFLLDRIGSEVALPDGPTLMLMGFVFLVEALILICVNPLLLRGELGFIRPYVLLAGAALVGAAAALWLGAHRLGDAPLVVLLALPALVQAAITLPVIAGKLANAQGRDLGGLLRGLGRALRLDIGRAA